MSVGVYIPFHNVGPYIIESINSIKSQTYKDWEIVLIDDCSTDNSFNTISEYLNKFPDPRIKVYKRDEHCGYIGKLKNECIAKLDQNHKYICHVGSDDTIPNYCFETFVKFMEDNKDVGTACGNFTCYDDKGNTWSFPHVANSGEFSSDTLLRYMCSFPMRFYRFDIVKKAGYYAEDLTSAVDYDLALKIDEITTIKRIIKPITYYYRQHSGQVSTKARPEQDSNAKKALERALKRRNIDGIVKNDRPPFIIEKKEEKHFIWGK